MRLGSIIVCLFLCCQFSPLLAKSAFLEQQYSINPTESFHSSRFPIVLQHGLFGFKKIFQLEYFHEIPKYLRSRGFQVFVTRVNPIGSVEERAIELSGQIDEILEMTGAAKVNIVAHSMGGLDARYLVSRLGYEDKVASISMIGTPNQGSYVADFALSTVLRATRYKRRLIALIGFSETKNESIIQDAIEAIYNVSELFVQREFNPNVPDVDGIYYQSWAGNSSITGLLTGDLLNPLFFLTYNLLRWSQGRNDGLVTIESAKWGHFQGYVPADHLDQIGFILGTMSPLFDHKDFYGDLVQGLVERGF